MPKGTKYVHDHSTSINNFLLSIVDFDTSTLFLDHKSLKWFHLKNGQKEIIDDNVTLYIKMMVISGSHFITSPPNLDDIIINEKLYHMMMVMSGSHFMTSHSSPNNILLDKNFSMRTTFISLACSFYEVCDPSMNPLQVSHIFHSSF